MPPRKRKGLKDVLLDIASNNLKSEKVMIEQPAVRRSKRIKQPKKEISDWLTENTSDKEVLSGEDYVAAESSSEEEEMASDAEEHMSSISKKSKAKPLNKPAPHSHRHYGVSVGSYHNSFGAFRDAMPWAYERIRKLEEEFEVTHPGILPDSEKWSLIDDSFSFPKSPAFKILSENKKTILSSRTLDAFSALPVKSLRDQLVLYAGAPVTSLSWCPRFVSHSGSKQYLAITTHTGLHSPDMIYNEKTLIQLWNCGSLDVSCESVCTPKISLKVLIQEGPVWDLKWCQFGGYMPKPKTGNSRLGILAAACGSGCVMIVSIPDPDYHAEYAVGSTFKVTPDMTLVPSKLDVERKDNMFGQCLCVDWCSSDGGKWLAGGYSKGLVCLWKLIQPSSLLQTMSSDKGTEIVACRVFTAHHKPVRGISWCPYQNDIFASAGSDCLLKFWNKNNVHTPVMQSLTRPKIGAVTELAWPHLCCGVFTSTDEVYTRPSLSGALYNDILDNLMTPYSIIPFKSCSQSVSFSDWMNSCVGVDSTGLVVLYLSNNLSTEMRLNNKKATPRFISSMMQVDWLDGRGSDSEPQYSIQFFDTDLKNLKNLKKRPCCKKAKILDSFPCSVNDEPYVKSVNRVSWNPNFGSHTWYCTGWQSGLVRLQNVGAIHASLNATYRDLSTA